MNNTVRSISQRKPAVQGSESRFTYAVLRYIHTAVWLFRSKYCWQHRQQSPKTTPKPSSGLKPKQKPHQIPTISQELAPIIPDSGCSVPECHALPVKLSFGPSYALLPSLLTPEICPLCYPTKSLLNLRFGSKIQQSYWSEEGNRTLWKIKVHL